MTKAEFKKMMKRRKVVAQKFLSGEWGVELAGFEEAQAKDREKDEELERAWRGEPPSV